MEKKVIGIMQSNYIPWKGYFDLINRVDEFVFDDEVQYTRHSWRNRNIIKSQNGLLWLTVPVLTKHRFQQKIRETKVNGLEWKTKHIKSIRLNYGRTSHGHDGEDFITGLYEEIKFDCLWEINTFLIKAICKYMEIRTTFRYSGDFNLAKGRSERIVDLCSQLNATHLLNGPSARGHMNEKMLEESGINVSYMNYSGYPEYSQPFPPFEHQVSILDLMLCTGRSAKNYISGAEPIPAADYPEES